MPWSTDQRVCRSTRRGPGRDRQTSCEGARLGERRCSGRACGSRRFERPGRCRWRRTAAGVPRASRTARVLARGRASRAGRGLLRGSRGQPPRFVWSVDQGSPAVCHVSAVCAADPTAPLHHVDPADGQKTPVFPPGQVGVESLLHQLPGPATGLPVVLERVLEQRARSRVSRIPLAALAALGPFGRRGESIPGTQRWRITDRGQSILGVGGSLPVWHPQPDQALPTCASRSTPRSIQSLTFVCVGSGLSGSLPSHNSNLSQADRNR